MWVHIRASDSDVAEKARPELAAVRSGVEFDVCCCRRRRRRRAGGPVMQRAADRIILLMRSYRTRFGFFVNKNIHCPNTKCCTLSEEFDLPKSNKAAVSEPRCGAFGDYVIVKGIYFALTDCSGVLGNPLCQIRTLADVALPVFIVTKVGQIIEVAPVDMGAKALSVCL